MHNQVKLNDKIAGIRDTLREMGEYLSDIEESPASSDMNLHSCGDSKGLIFEDASLKRNQESNQLKTLLSSEIDKNHMLTMRINHKDEVLTEMSLLQNELYGNLEELSKLNMKLNSEVKELRGKCTKLTSELEQREREVQSNRGIEASNEIERLRQKVLELENTQNEAKIDTLYNLLIKKDKAISVLETEKVAIEKLFNELKGKQKVAETQPISQDEIPRNTLETARSLTSSPVLSSNIILSQLMDLLNVKDVAGIYRKTAHLYSQHTKEKSARKFIESIGNFMEDLAPAETYQNKPTHRHIWKWVTSTAENYTVLKDSIEGKHLRKLEKLLQVPSCELYSTVKRLLSK